MKKNLFYVGALVLGLTMAAGCSNEEGLEKVQSGKKTVVEAIIENSAARTSVNELYQVVWSENDAFSVWGTSYKGNMTLQAEDAGSTKGDFEGTITLVEGDKALFPAGNTTAMVYEFKSAYTDTETDAPMLGTYNGTSFTFNHLAAMLRVNASGLTAGTQYVLTITSTGDQILTGSAILGDNNALIPTGDGKSLTVTLTPATDVTSLTFDAPIPAQTYAGLNVTLKAGDAEATTLKTLTSFEAKAGVLYEATTKVTTADALITALAKGGNIDLESDIQEITEDLNVTQNTIIDLNGKTLNTGEHSIKVAEGKNLTIQNAASLARSANAPTITGSGDIITASSNSTIVIGEGVYLTSTENCCVFIPRDVTNATITTAGELISKSQNYAAIQANGNASNITVNIIGGSVKGACTGVYFPCTTNLNISGGTIEGATAVYHKSGNLNISSGTLKATGVKADYVHGGSGCTDTGDALVVEACDYPGGVPVVSITGGTFISENNKAIGYYQQSEDYKLANENFITGGTFSDPSACYYLGAGADVNVDITKDYEGPGFKTKSGQKVALNIASGKTYKVTSPLVGSTGTQTLGFQFLQGSTVTIQGGGTITSSDAKMLINNYSDLTLKGVTLAPTIPDTMNGQAYYVLSNNCGTVNIEDGTTITAPESNDATNCPTVYAFDVCKYGSYPSVTVNVKGGEINGDVEYTGEGESQKLNITGGTIIGNLVVKDGVTNAAISIFDDATITGDGWDSYKN